MTNGAAANSVLLGDGSGVASWGSVGNAQLANDGASLDKVTGGRFAMSGGSMQGDSSSNFALFDPAVIKVQAFPNTITGGGIVRTFGPNGILNAAMSFLTGSPNNGYVNVMDAAGSNQAGIYVNSAGLGIVFGDTKAFLVPDPEDDTKNIMYACIEGPEAAMYTRGTARLVNGEAHIDLPDHFRKLAAAQGITVVLTPKSRGSLGLGFENESPSSFDVFELNNGKGNYDFAWEIKAVRKGHENWQAERPWDEALPGGDKKQQWEARLKSLEARRNQGKP
jgi:hypothetical protein